MSTWQIDTKHSAATFTIRHMMSKVRGTVGVVAGTIEGRIKAVPDLTRSLNKDLLAKAKTGR